VNEQKCFNSISARLPLSAIIGFSFAFIFFFAGILDIFAINNQELPINFAEALIIAAGVFLVCGFIASIFLLGVPGKLFKIAVSLVAGFVMTCYIQGTFLNSNLGELTGEAVGLTSGNTEIIANTLIFAVLLFLPLLFSLSFSRRNEKLWENALRIISVTMCGMSAVTSLSNLFTRSAFDATPKYSHYLNADAVFELSSHDNIVVFIVDLFDYDRVVEIREKDPTFFDRLDGFTEFTDAISLYTYTYPSVTYMITGIPGFYDKTPRRYFDEAWGNSAFIPYLKENNYEMKYHIYFGNVYNSPYHLLGKADNLVGAGSAQMSLNWLDTAEIFMKLSAYRYAPVAAKSLFWLPTVDIPYTSADGVNIAEYNDPLFYRRLLENGLSLQDKKNSYLFIHLQGSHYPYAMDENANESDNTDANRQTMGCFKILYEYLDEMKNLGIYKDSTVIITADHGRAHKRGGKEVMNIGMFIKPKGSAALELKKSDAPVSIANLMPAVLQSEGLDYSNFGMPAFDVPMDTVRYGYYFSDYNHKLLEYFEIRGKASDLSNWHKIKETDRIYTDWVEGK